MRAGDIAELRAFMEIVERGNFARAAQWLGLTPSALTQTIRRLEERLGQRLLNRTTRSTRPTEEGKKLYDRIRPALAEIEAAQAELLLPTGQVRGTLRINASRAGAIHAIAPHLAGFTRLHPAIEIDISVSDRFRDVVTSGCDAGVRLGEALEQDMIRLPLSGPVRWIAVASPDYLAGAGRPLHPRDLLDHQCINMRWPSTGHLFQWEFEREGDVQKVSVKGPLCTNDAATRLQAVADGIGIGYFLETEAAAMIASGAIVDVLSEWCPPDQGFYLYYPGNRILTPPLRAFCDYICGR
jgi:DNA-binding transcriptional LysR family regulator